MALPIILPIRTSDNINSASDINALMDNCTDLDDRVVTLDANLKTNNLVINGTKTFTSLPEIPTTEPTTSNQAVSKSYSDRRKPIKERFVVYETDFISDNIIQGDFLLGAAVASGTRTYIAGTPNHPGIVQLNDSTTANGGYQYTTNVTAFSIAGGERAVFVFEWNTARTTCQARMGWQDTIVVTNPVDCVCLEITGAGVIGGICRSNNSETATATTFSLTQDAWYSGEIIINADATLVTFTVYSEAGAVVWTNTVATNIPKGAGRETGFGVIATQSTTDAAGAIIQIDYIGLEINRSLVR